MVDDFVDMTTDRDRYGVVAGDHLLIMRDAVCATGREALVSAARRQAPDRRVFTRGTYVVTEGPRFESPAEVRFLQTLGDVVGQSFCPEVWLARDIGACYAGVYLIVNYGEGVVREWEHEVLAQIFHEDAGPHGPHPAGRPCGPAARTTTASAASCASRRCSAERRPSRAGPVTARRRVTGLRSPSRVTPSAPRRARRWC